MGGTHRKARSDSDAGIHRQRAMQKFYPRRALPPRAPPCLKYLETIYHLRCKGKASPEGNAKISSEAGLAPSGSPRVSNILKPSIIRAARGRHRQRAMQKFYPRRALPPRAPPCLKYLETIYHLRRKGKALPKAMQKFYPRRALPPRAPPCRKYLETIYHSRRKWKA